MRGGQHAGSRTPGESLDVAGSPAASMTCGDCESSKALMLECLGFFEWAKETEDPVLWDELGFEDTLAKLREATSVNRPASGAFSAPGTRPSGVNAPPSCLTAAPPAPQPGGAAPCHVTPCTACDGQGSLVARLHLSPGHIRSERDVCEACGGWGYTPPPRDDDGADYAAYCEQQR